jgi:hypothetical protein
MKCCCLFPLNAWFLRPWSEAKKHKPMEELVVTRGLGSGALSPFHIHEPLPLSRFVNFQGESTQTFVSFHIKVLVVKSF